MPKARGTKAGRTKPAPRAAKAAKATRGGLTGMIRARIDPALKAEAEAVLEELGLSASDVIRVLYRQVAIRRGLPFDLKIPNATTRRAMRDVERGKGLTRYEDTAAMFADLGLADGDGR